MQQQTPKRMQSVIKKQIEIAWPIKALFHYMSDAETHPQWRQHVLHATWLGAEKNKPGTDLLEMREVLGKTIPVKMKVTRVTAYRKRELMIANKSMNTFYTVDYESVGDHTLLTLTVRCEAKRKISKQRVAEQLANNGLDELKRLKRMLETE